MQFGRLWDDTSDHAIGYAMHSSRSAQAPSGFVEIVDDDFPVLHGGGF
jgi:hypothetical protein